MRNATLVGASILLATVIGCAKATVDESRGAAGSNTTSPARPVPRLVDVGAGKCIPCKAMAPILDQLRVDYAGRMDVVFVDVWKDPAAAQPYAIQMIPTQIFYGTDGRELARHQGFMSREEILAQWKAVGVGL